MLKALTCFYRLIIQSLAAFLPTPLAYGLARLYGDWRYQRDRARREMIARNLGEGLCEQLSEVERVSIVRDFFRLRYCEAVDMLRLAGNRQAFTRLVEIRGQEYLDAALAEGKGAVLCGAHFGSYYASASPLLASGIPVTIFGLFPAITEEPAPSTVWFAWQRGMAHHTDNYSYRPAIQARQAHAALRIANRLRANEVIAMNIDLPAKTATSQRTVSTTLLGKQTEMPSGCVTIAHLTDAPILMYFLHRSADWRHQVLEILPPIAMADDMAITFGRCIAAVEAAILRNPAHWIYWDQPDMLTNLGLLSSTISSAPDVRIEIDEMSVLQHS
ncbi:MAG: lysophospholipid acyltransferase family protein [Ktedonobacteraceae bacterium]